MNESYVHGYKPREHERLMDQAQTLADLLHAGTAYPAGSRVLEVGCGVGAQTVLLARRSPGALLTSIDISPASLAEARVAAASASLRDVEFVQADVFDLPFEANTFDHVFVCFVLEHLTRPVAALAALRRVLRPGGSLTVIEGDHGSVLFHPESDAAREVIACQVELQRRAGGNALLGRELFPMLSQAGFDAVTVEPRTVYADASRPTWVDGFTRGTFTAMIEGVADRAVSSGLMDREAFDSGVRALRRTAVDDGVFCYTFFKASARAGSDPA